MPFNFTSEMHEWLNQNQTTFAGDFSVIDAWTYGRIEVTVENGSWTYWTARGRS